jgi:hypothetical protein
METIKNERKAIILTKAFTIDSPQGDGNNDWGIFSLGIPDAFTIDSPQGDGNALCKTFAARSCFLSRSIPRKGI